MGKRPTAAERRAEEERYAEANRKYHAAERERLIVQMTGDLAIADVLLDRTDPNRPSGHNAEPTLLRAFLLAAMAHVHRAAETARFLHPREHLSGKASRE